MKSFIFIFTLTLTTFATLAAPPRRRPPPPSPTPTLTLTLPNKVVGFYFVQEWPPAFCDIYNNQHKATRSRCRKDLLVSNFTVHGFWPYRIDGTVLAPTKSTCLGAPYFGKEFERDLVVSVPALKKVWPDYVQTNDQKELWRCEYNRHGACVNPKEAGQYNVITQQEYFDNAIRLKNHVNIYQILGKNGITPNDEKYSVKKIKDAIMNESRLTPILKCETNGTHMLLLEVKLCVDKSAKQFIRCQSYESQKCGNDRDMVTFKSVTSLA